MKLHKFCKVILIITSYRQLIGDQLGIPILGGSIPWLLRVCLGCISGLIFFFCATFMKLTKISIKVRGSCFQRHFYFISKKKSDVLGDIATTYKNSSNGTTIIMESVFNLMISITSYNLLQ